MARTRIDLALSLVLLASCGAQVDEAPDPGSPGVCSGLALRHEVLAKLDAEVTAQIAADGATEAFPEAAYVARTAEFTYLFDYEVWSNQEEGVLVYSTEADFLALPAENVLRKHADEIEIDWATESLVVALEYPRQHAYRYARAGDALQVHAARPKPCAAYGEDLAHLYAYRDVVRVYRVPRVASASVHKHDGVYRFSDVEPENTCSRKSPVISGGGNPAVIRDGGRFRMWWEGYSAATGVFFTSWSDDGETWTPAGWDQGHKTSFAEHSPYPDHYSASPLKRPDGSYWLFYQKLQYVAAGVIRTIARASSPDGLAFSDEQIMLGVGEPGQWDDGFVQTPHVLEREGRYWMWYAGGSEADPRPAIGVATSDDGLTWVRHPSNPVLTAGPLGSFDDLGVLDPEVRLKDGVFHLWYTASTGGGDAARPARATIGLATSPDGVSGWKRRERPLLAPKNALEGHLVAAPAAHFEGSEVLIWYTGINTRSEPVVSMARCPAP